MILQRINFEIPAQFAFQPFSAKWRLVIAETVEWVKEPKLEKDFDWFKEPIVLNPLRQVEDNAPQNEVTVRVEVPSADNALGMLSGPLFGICPAFTVNLDRVSIPRDVLLAHENHINTPDILGRKFQVLICQKPEFKDPRWTWKPEDVIKNARIMRSEFLNIEADPVLGWDWGAQQFLNKWGLWGSSQIYVEAWDIPPVVTAALLELKGERAYKIENPGLIMLIPHLLKEQQEKYRKALVSRNTLAWLRSHPLKLETANEFPFHRVRTSYCSDAIEATITIDLLDERKFGICKRCHTVFEKEKKYRMAYCSRTCANAASVARFRDKQRNATKKGAKRNAKG